MEQKSGKASRAIRELLERKAIKRIVDRLEKLHPADVAEALENYTLAERKLIFSKISDELATRLLREMEPDEAFEIMKGLGKERLLRILDNMPSDEKVDILAKFPENKLEELLTSMEQEDAREAKDLLRYDEESAGGLMATEIVYVTPDLTVGELLEKLRKNNEILETAHYIYITDEKQRLVGEVSLRQLLMASPDTKIKDIMNPNVIRVSLDDDQEKVAAVVAKYDLISIPVVDEQNRLKGIITVDDVIDVIEEEATEDMYLMVGLDEEEEEKHSPLRSAISRIPWLTFTLFGSICTGNIINLYSDTIKQAMALLVFMPAIMGMGGNTGLQSSTIVVRGIATGDIKGNELYEVVTRELKTALLLGIIVGSIIATICLIWKQNPVLGAIVGTAMLCQVTVAVLVGMMIPFLLHRMGVDPAISAGPIVTMLSDIHGLIIYFSIASMALAYFGGT